MSTATTAVRRPRPISILWKWTGVSAILHVVIIALLCSVSWWGFQKREKARLAKEAAEETAATKAAEAAATPEATPQATPAAAEATPAEAAEAAPTPKSAEQVLGIDKTASPDATPPDPFSTKSDDLLKDLK